MLAFTSRFLIAALALAPGAIAAGAFKKLDKNNAALLIVDHQVGLFHLVQDMNKHEFANNVIAHAALGPIFDLPTVLTTSAETGPNGPLPKEILALYPNSTIIRRNGEVDAWGSEEFRNAVRATGKTQLILAGITTDVCTAFLALSLVEAGYEVFANADASGTFNRATAQDANDRMRDAGVQVLSSFAVVGYLMRDWRETPGAKELLPYFSKFLPLYGYLARAHVAAVSNGTIMPGQEDL